jgi:hypothetical protein
MHTRLKCKKVMLKYQQSWKTTQPPTKWVMLGWGEGALSIGHGLKQIVYGPDHSPLTTEKVKNGFSYMFS